MEAPSRPRLLVRVRRVAWLAAFCLLGASGLQAQAFGTLMGGTGFDHGRFTNGEFTGLARFGLGFSHGEDSHVLAAWNILGVSFDRLQHHNGGSVETSLMGMLSLAPGTTHSNSPLLLGEAGIGHRWGAGPFGGYTELGVGAGWAIGSHIPFIEVRRRFPTGSARADNQILVGIHFVLFD